MENSGTKNETSGEKAQRLKLLKMAFNQAFQELGQSLDKNDEERNSLRNAIERLRAEIKVYEPDFQE